MRRRVCAIIDLNAISENTRAIKNRIGNQTLCAVVKADGYGHGAEQTADVCLKNGASHLAVAICEEGIALRNSGITAPILILGYTPAAQLDDVIQHDLTQTVFSHDMAKELTNAARKNNQRAKAHIKIDTGMSRLGYLPKESSVSELTELFNDKFVNILGIYTHFATSDEPNSSFVYEQKERFDWFLSFLFNRLKRGKNEIIVHAANSGAIVNYPNITYDMARAGITLFGLPPANNANTDILLKPAMSVVSQISSVKDVDADTSISYARSFFTQRVSRIATVPVGYADGYPRNLSNKSHVIINGAYAPVVGMICMDQMVIDVTDCTASPGDKVTLMGENSGCCISADNLATILNTINYEIICGIGKRVPRVYV